MRLLQIDTREWEPFECSYMLLAAMAYPGKKQESERMHAFESLVARALSERQRLDQDERDFANFRLNRYRELKSEHEASLLTRKVRRLLTRRSEIGDMAEPWARELLLGDAPELSIMSEPALADRFALRWPERDAEMWIRRVWRPAKPVFHLFAAYHLVALAMPDEMKNPFDTRSEGSRAPDGPTTSLVAQAAMIIQERMCSDERFPFQKDQVIWLEWIEPICDEPLKTAPDQSAE